MRNPESIKRKLKAYSKAKGKIHQNILTKFFQERFLYRLSQSEYRENFLLKGGALAYTFSGEESRHTKDVDFLLTQLSAEGEFLKSVFAEIAEIDGNDGVIFDPKTIRTEVITKEGNYTGTRIKVEAKLGNIKQQIQVDIGVGDYVTNGPKEITYPTILDELAAPKLLAYSVETLVAEKFNVMIDLGIYNSRLKDFYDIYKFVELCNAKILTEAVKNTFQVRGTTCVKVPAVFQEEFYADEVRRKQWAIFLERNHLEQLEFREIHTKLNSYLKPVYETIGEC